MSWCYYDTMSFFFLFPFGPWSFWSRFRQSKKRYLLVCLPSTLIRYVQKHFFHFFTLLSVLDSVAMQTAQIFIPVWIITLIGLITLSWSCNEIQSVFKRCNKCPVNFKASKSKLLFLNHLRKKNYFPSELLMLTFRTVRNCACSVSLFHTDVN